MSVKLELYRVFKEVAEAGNITAAASKMLARVEITIYFRMGRPMASSRQFISRIE